MCAGRLILAPQFRLQPESSHTRRHTLCSLDRANESSAHLQARAGAHPPPTHAAAQVSDFAGPQLPLSFAFSHLPCSSDRESPLSDGHGVAARRDAPGRRPPAGDRRRTRRHLRVLRAAPERRSHPSSPAPALAAAQHSVDPPRPGPPCQCVLVWGRGRAGSRFHCPRPRPRPCPRPGPDPLQATGRGQARGRPNRRQRSCRGRNLRRALRGDPQARRRGRRGAPTQYDTLIPPATIIGQWTR